MYAMKVVVGPASKVCSNYKGGCGIALKSFAVRGAPERSMLSGIASKVPNDSSNMMQNMSTCETRQQEGMQPPSAAWPPSDRELLPAGKALIELQSLQAARLAGAPSSSNMPAATMPHNMVQKRGGAGSSIKLQARRGASRSGGLSGSKGGVIGGGGQKNAKKSENGGNGPLYEGGGSGNSGFREMDVVIKPQENVDDHSWDNGRTSGSQYIRLRVRRKIDEGKSERFVDGTVEKWLSAQESDFTSDLTNSPAALWHIVFDDKNIGEEDMEEHELKVAILTHRLDHGHKLVGQRLLRTFEGHGEYVGQVAEYDEDLAVTGRILSDEKVFVESLSVTLHGGTVPSLGKFRVVYANGVYEEWLSWEEVMASVVLGRYSHAYLPVGPVEKKIASACTSTSRESHGGGKRKGVVGGATGIASRGGFTGGLGEEFAVGNLLPDIFARPSLSDVWSWGVEGEDTHMSEEGGTAKSEHTYSYTTRTKQRTLSTDVQGGNGISGDAMMKWDRYIGEVKDLNMLLINQPPLPLILDERQLIEVEDRGCFFPARVLSLEESTSKVRVHFLNWSDKHNQTVPCASNRIRLPPSTDGIHDFVEAPSMVPNSCRTLAEVVGFKQTCEKEESGVRKSGRRRGLGDGGEEEAGAEFEDKPTRKSELNSAGMYLPASKKKGMPALILTTRGLSTKALADACSSLLQNAALHNMCTQHKAPAISNGNSQVPPSSGVPHPPAALPAGGGGGILGGVGVVMGGGSADFVGPNRPSVAACTDKRANLLGLKISGVAGACVGSNLVRKLDKGFDSVARPVACMSATGASSASTNKGDGHKGVGGAASSSFLAGGGSGRTALVCGGSGRGAGVTGKSKSSVVVNGGGIVAGHGGAAVRGHAGGGGLGGKGGGGAAGRVGGGRGLGISEKEVDTVTRGSPLISKQALQGSSPPPAPSHDDFPLGTLLEVLRLSLSLFVYHKSFSGLLSFSFALSLFLCLCLSVISHVPPSLL